MGAPLGNRNAAGSRGGSATNRMRAAVKRGKSKRTLAKLTGMKPRQKMIYSMKYHKYVSAKKYYGS